jgi:hypothetical protein
MGRTRNVARKLRRLKSTPKCKEKNCRRNILIQRNEKGKKKEKYKGSGKIRSQHVQRVGGKPLNNNEYRTAHRCSQSCVQFVQKGGDIALEFRLRLIRRLSQKRILSLYSCLAQAV